MATLTTADPAEVLKALYSVRRDQIPLDCAAAARSARHWGKIDKLFAHAEESSIPEVVANALHRRMCRAHAVYQRHAIPVAERLYFAAAAANAVAEFAEEAARGSGRMAELSRTIEAIKAREGIAVEDDEEFLDGDAPADYIAATAEFDALQKQAYGAEFWRILRRYGLGAVARLKLNNRARYDELFEKGRKSLFVPRK